MKKYIFALSTLLLVISCSTKQSNQEKSDSQQTTMKTEKPSLEYKEVIIDDEPALIGEISEAELQTTDYEHWYSFYKEDYSVNQDIVQTFADDIKDFELKVFIGTWCTDSHAQGPAFFKIMEEADYPTENIQMFSLDQDKVGLNGVEKKYNVLYVPTFIFIKDGKEVGRIVESPINSLEEDIRDIVQGKPQTPNYAE